LEARVVLLLEAADLVHVDGEKVLLTVLFVGGELLVADRLEADSGVVTDADNEDLAPLDLASLVMLVGEGDADLRDVVGGVWGRARVLEHGLAVATNDEDARSAVVLGLDGEASVVEAALVILVHGQSLVVELTLHAAAADEVEGRGGNEADKDETQEDEGKVNHPLLAILNVGANVGFADNQQVSLDEIDRRHSGGADLVSHC
jgi:hypothetical protein